MITRSRVRTGMAALALVGATFLGAPAVGAQDYPDDGAVGPQQPSVSPAEVTPVVVEEAATATPRVAAQTPQAGGLPVTGTDTAVLAGAGALFIAGGGALVLRSRRATA